MANPCLQLTLRRAILVASSTVILFLAAISLTSAIGTRAPNRVFALATSTQNATVHIHAGQAVAKVPSSGNDGLEGSSIPNYSPTTARSSNGQIAQATSASQLDATKLSADTSTSAIPVASSHPLPNVPILVLSYTNSGGPKHCRGTLLQKARFERPATEWKNGTCITLPQDARCGVFLAAKEDNCEAHLFSQEQCINSTQTYVNTVVFMPEERAVGALWRSMLVKCGVEVPDVKMLEPSILGGLLKKPTNDKRS